MAEKQEYLIKVQGQLIPVTKEVYLIYYRMKRHELYLEEKDRAHGVFYYSALDTEETKGEDAIPDLTSLRVDELVMNSLCMNSSTNALQSLPRKSRRLFLPCTFIIRANISMQKK